MAKGTQRIEAALSALGAAFLLLSIPVLLNRWLWLSAQPYPLEYGSFYYLQEVSYRLSHGGVGYYHSFSPFFLFMTTLAKLSSPVQSYRIIVLGSLCLFSASVGFLAARRSSWPVGAALGYLALQSEPLFFGHYAYLKEGSAMALLALGAVLMEAAESGRKGNKMLSSLALVALILSAIFHRFAAVSAVFLLLVWGKGFFSSRKFKLSVLAVLALVILGYTILHPKHVGGFLQIFSRLAWEDGGILTQKKLQYRLYAVVACLFVSAAAWTSRAKFPWLLWNLYFFLILPVWKVDQGYFHRFPLSSIWIFCIGSAVSLRGREDGWTDGFFRGIVLACAFAAFLITLIVPEIDYQMGPPMRIESLAVNKAMLQAWIPEEAVIRAPHGIQFRATYFLRRRAQQADLPSDALVQFMLRPSRPPGMECRDINELHGKIAPEVPCVQLDPEWFIWRIPAS